MDVDRLIASLVEARDYYQNMLKHASSQLEHIQGLLDGFGGVNSLPKISSQQIFPLDNSLPQSEMNDSSCTSSASKDVQDEKKEPKSKPEAVNSTPIIEVPPAPEAVTIPTPDIDDVDEDDDSSDSPEEDLATATLQNTEDDDDREDDNTENDEPDNGFADPEPANNSAVTKNRPKPVASTPAKRSLTNNSRKRRPARQIPPLSIPFAPKMAGMRLGDAIESVLREHPETVSHTDYIVRAIYGQLEGVVLRTAKDRVTKELSRGYKLGRWYRLPDTPGCYTVSRRLAQSKS